MTVHINLSDRKPYMLSVADAVAALSDEAGFQSGDQARITCGDLTLDLPPLKWSSLKYGFAVEDRIDGKEEAYS